jgi:death-on-curing family protein
MTNFQIKWLDKEDIFAALKALFYIYPQNNKQKNCEELEINIIKPDVIDYIVNLKSNNYYGNDVLYIASTIIRTVIKGHPLMDGNKRFGILLGERFIEQNGFKISTRNSDFEKIAFNTAKGKWDKDEIYFLLKEK